MTLRLKGTHGVVLALAALLALHAGTTVAAPKAAPDVRQQIAATQALPPGAIDELKAVPIGGIRQWISVRGADPKNPILLFLHGGPGTPMMGEAWTYQRPWEDFFTVVQWDQRGAGKTFSEARRKEGAPLSVDLMANDTIALIDYLRQTYGKRKVILMGHSWGSVLGLEVAKRRPDLLYAYVGIGQVINMVRNEAAGYELTLAEARRQNNAKAVAQLEAIAPYPEADGSLPLQKTAVERPWAVALRGMIYTRTSLDDAELRLSPQYSNYDVASADQGEMKTVLALWPELSKVDYTGLHELGCPLVIFAGAHDTVTPGRLSKAFFDQVQAPSKQYFLVPNASHYVVNEAPGVALMHLVNDVLPLATEDGATR